MGQPCAIRAIDLEAPAYTRPHVELEDTAVGGRSFTMLLGLRRWLTGGAGGDPRLRPLADWADARGARLRLVKQEVGGVVEGRTGSQPWRLEWGAPQRDYIPGMELRLMAETRWPHDLTALLLRRPLVAEMERVVYEQIVDDVRTRIDTDTPPEMRWLMLYPRLGAGELGPLREHWAALASVKPWLLGWLASPLADALEAAAAAAPANAPALLQVHRGRLLLRVALPEPEATALQHWWAVFDAALRHAPSPPEGGTARADDGALDEA